MQMRTWTDDLSLNQVSKNLFVERFLQTDSESFGESVVIIPADVTKLFPQGNTFI